MSKNVVHEFNKHTEDQVVDHTLFFLKKRFTYLFEREIARMQESA